MDKAHLKTKRRRQPISVKREESGDALERAVDFYNSTLKEQLELSDKGRFVAIHPDSMEYRVGAKPSKIYFELRDLHEEGQIIVYMIGAFDERLLSKFDGPSL